jgi:hypothetical protein
MTRFAILAFLMLAALPAQAGTDPVAFVTAGYKMLAANKASPADQPAQSFATPRLKALFDLETHDANGEVGRLDFDYWTNAQDWKLSDVAVKGVPVESAKDREVVIATFRNLGKKQEIHFYFEKIASRWLLDDVRSVTGETWTLSLILKYGWDGKD